jgi:hypothetical protein
MGQNTAPERPQLMVGATRRLSISFEGQLDSGELLTGTPTITEQATTDLTITNKAVSTTALTINSKTVAIGEAVTCLVSGHVVANSPYTLSVSAGTDATDAQTLPAEVVFDAVTE